jgi:hypothetical protein
MSDDWSPITVTEKERMPAGTVVVPHDPAAKVVSPAVLRHKLGGDKYGPEKIVMMKTGSDAGHAGVDTDLRIALGLASAGETYDCEHRPASFFDYLRLRSDAVALLIVAILSFVATIIATVAALAASTLKPVFAVVIFLSALVGAVMKLRSDWKSLTEG